MWRTMRGAVLSPGWCRVKDEAFKYFHLVWAAPKDPNALRHHVCFSITSVVIVVLALCLLDEDGVRFTLAWVRT